MSLLDEELLDLGAEGSSFLSSLLCLSGLLSEPLLLKLDGEESVLLLFGFLLSLDLSLDGIGVSGLLTGEMVLGKGSLKLVLSFELFNEIECFFVKPRNDVVIKDVDSEIIGEETDVSEVLVGVVPQTSKVFLRHNSGHDFPVSKELVLLLLSHGALELGEVLESLLLLVLHSLNITGLRLADSGEVSLLLSHFFEFLLLEHLHSGDFEGLTTED